MLSEKTNNLVGEFFVRIARTEKKLEVIRQMLCEFEQFEPYSSFQRIDRSRNNLLTAPDVVQFLRENQQKAFTEEQVYNTFIKQYDIDEDGVLCFAEFLRSLLPADQPILRTMVSQRPIYDVSAKDVLEDEIEYTLTKLITEEINSFMELEPVKEQIVGSPDFSYESLFEEIDQQNLGFVDFNNLFEFFRKNAFYPYEEEIIAILRRLDKNDDGRLNLNEFIEAMSPKGLLQTPNKLESSTAAASNLPKKSVRNEKSIEENIEVLSQRIHSEKKKSSLIEVDNDAKPLDPRKSKSKNQEDYEHIRESEVTERKSRLVETQLMSGLTEKKVENVRTNPKSSIYQEMPQKEKKDDPNVPEYSFSNKKSGTMNLGSTFTNTPPRYPKPVKQGYSNLAGEKTPPHFNYYPYEPVRRAFSPMKESIMRSSKTPPKRMEPSSHEKLSLSQKRLTGSNLKPSYAETYEEDYQVKESFTERKAPDYEPVVEKKRGSIHQNLEDSGLEPREKRLMSTFIQEKGPESSNRASAKNSIVQEKPDKRYSKAPQPEERPRDPSRGSLHEQEDPQERPEQRQSKYEEKARKTLNMEENQPEKRVSKTVNYEQLVQPEKKNSKLVNKEEIQPQPDKRLSKPLNYEEKPLEKRLSKPANYEENQLEKRLSKLSNYEENQQVEKRGSKPMNYEESQQVEKRGSKPMNYEENQQVEKRASKPMNYEESQLVEKRGSKPMNYEENPIEKRGSRPMNYEESQLEKRGSRPANYEENALEKRGSKPVNPEENQLEKRGSRPINYEENPVEKRASKLSKYDENPSDKRGSKLSNQAPLYQEKPQIFSDERNSPTEEEFKRGSFGVSAKTHEKKPSVADVKKLSVLQEKSEPLGIERRVSSKSSQEEQLEKAPSEGKGLSSRNSQVHEEVEKPAYNPDEKKRSKIAEQLYQEQQKRYSQDKRFSNHEQEEPVIQEKPEEKRMSSKNVVSEDKRFSKSQNVEAGYQFKSQIPAEEKRLSNKPGEPLEKRFSTNNEKKFSVRNEEIVENPQKISESKRSSKYRDYQERPVLSGEEKRFSSKGSEKEVHENFAEEKRMSNKNQEGIYQERRHLAAEEKRASTASSKKDQRTPVFQEKPVLLQEEKRGSNLSSREEKKASISARENKGSLRPEDKAHQAFSSMENSDGSLHALHEKARLQSLKIDEIMKKEGGNNSLENSGIEKNGRRSDLGFYSKTEVVPLKPSERKSAPLILGHTSFNSEKNQANDSNISESQAKSQNRKKGHSVQAEYEVKEESEHEDEDENLDEADAVKNSPIPENAALPEEIVGDIVKYFKTLVSCEEELERCKQDLALRPDFNLVDFFLFFDKEKQGFCVKEEFQEVLAELGVQFQPPNLILFLKRFSKGDGDTLKFYDFSEAFLPLFSDYADLLNQRKPINIDFQFKFKELFSPETRRLIIQTVKMHLENEECLEAIREAIVRKENSLEWEALFDHFDLNRDDFISEDELKECLENSDVVIGKKEMEMIFERVDLDKDGKISFEEFQRELIPRLEYAID